MVRVGIIGLGSERDTRYWPVLSKLRSRIRVCAVYDAVASRAHLVAEQVQAEAVEGCLALSDRSDVQALLVLDRSWQKDALLPAIVARRKPVFLSHAHDIRPSLLQQLQATAVESGLTIMPELSRRYTPATVRLQELMATRIGQPQQITLALSRPIPDATVDEGGRMLWRGRLTGWLDWCQHLIRRRPSSVSAESLTSAPADDRAGSVSVVRILFEGPKLSDLKFSIRQTAPLTASVEMSFRETPLSNSADDEPRIVVACESGTAVVDGAARISWTAQSGDVNESLTSERSEVEVMLDHFCRRVVGGLVPVPDLGDVIRSLRIAQAVERCLQTGETAVIDASGSDSDD